MTMTRAALALLALLGGGTGLSAQIIIGDANARDDSAKPDYVICTASLRDGRTAWSGRVFVDSRHTRQIGLDDAYKAYLEGQFGSVRDVNCAVDPYPWRSLPAADSYNAMTGWTGTFPTSRPVSGRASAAASPPAKTPAPVAKVDPKLATPTAPRETRDARLAREAAEDEAYRRALAEHDRQVASTAQAQRDFEARKASQHDAVTAVQQDYQQRYAEADAAQGRYQRALADHQALVRQLETPADRNAKVDWREAVTVCKFDTANPQSKFGN
ncbi:MULTISPECIES: hypothetical protein [Sphingomonas]|uniref:hypothetical protein n=1 Tax=Sphingomonas TaxID=13687 RepID=UPI000DEF2DB7|nr:MULTISPECIES: hypothetical protein [Sphingomonas]